MSMKLSQVLSTLSDEDSFEILQKVVKTDDSNSVKIEKADYGTPRKYYNRLTKLRDASQIRKVPKVKGSYQPTLLGKIVHHLLQTAQAACDLSWRLAVIDDLFRNQPELPQEEKHTLVRKLIPDPRIQRIIFQEELFKQ